MKKNLLAGLASTAVVFAALIIFGRQASAQTQEESLRKELEDLKKVVQGQQAQIEALTHKLDEIVKQAPPQQPTAGAPGAEEGKKLEPTAGYKDGFFIKSEDGNFEVRLNEWLRTQYRSWSVGDTRRDDTFAIPEAETSLHATLFKKYTLRVNYDLATSRLLDGFLNIAFSPAVQVQMGRFKEPFSLEEMTSGSMLECIRRSLPNNLTPRRDMGLMVFGKLFKGDILSYQAGIFNGDPNNTRDIDSNNDKDFAARLVLRPFGAAENEYVKNMQFGVAFTEGKQDMTIGGTRFTNEAGATFFQYLAGVRAYGDRSRFGAEFGWPIGSFLFRGEYITTDHELRRTVGGVWQDETVDMDGWYFQASWILTGERKLMKLLEPEKLFDPGEGCWGCVELVARYSEISLDDDVFTGGYAAAGLWPGNSSGTTIGLNWGLTKQIRLSLDYIHNEYEEDITIEGEPEDDEDAILFCVQVVY